MKKGTFKRLLCILFSFIFIFSMTPSIEVSAKSKLYKTAIKKYKELLLDPYTQYSYMGYAGQRFSCVDIDGNNIPELFIDTGNDELRDYYGLPSNAIVTNMFTVNKQKKLSMIYSSWDYDINWYYCKSKSTILIEWRYTKQLVEKAGYCNYIYFIYKFKNNKLNFLNRYTKRKYANGKTKYFNSKNKAISSKKAKKLKLKYLPNSSKIKFHSITAKNIKKYVK